MHQSFGNHQWTNVCRLWPLSAMVFQSNEWNVAIVSSVECFVVLVLAMSRPPPSCSLWMRIMFVYSVRPTVLQTNMIAATIRVHFRLLLPTTELAGDSNFH